MLKLNSFVRKGMFFSWLPTPFVRSTIYFYMILILLKCSEYFLLFKYFLLNKALIVIGDLLEFERGHYRHWAVYIGNGSKYENEVVHLCNLGSTGRWFSGGSKFTEGQNNSRNPVQAGVKYFSFILFFFLFFCNIFV